MIKKKKFLLLSNLTVVSLMSIGFSSFMILDSKHQEIVIESGEVVHLENAITIYKELNDLNYCSEGFVEEDNIVTNPKLSVFLNFDYSSIKEVASNKSVAFHFDLTLSMDETVVDLVSKCMDESSLLILLSVTDGSESSLPSYSTTNTISYCSYKTELIFESSLDGINKFRLYLDYTLDTTNVNFEKDVYPYIENKNVNFDFEVSYEIR